MQIKSIQTLLIVGLILTASALHLQHQQQQKIYYPEKYQAELQITQDKLKADLLEIQNQFKKLDQALKQAADDPNQQLKLYEEGIADQRDQLYKIQQYLNLPFNQRACKCIEFDEKLRKKLADQLTQSRESLDNLENQAAKCSDCLINQEIKVQIQQQRNYIKMMQDTLDAKCCKVYKFIYNDNLEGTKWVYGTYTDQQYKKWMTEQTNKYKTAQTIVRPCPVFSPFAIQNLQKCTACANQNQFWNLSTRKCQTCPAKKIYDQTERKCTFNVTCPQGSKFNDQSLQCQKIIQPYNNSYCPPATPIWNSQLRGCFRCEPSTPYFDRNTQRCIACPDKYTYNANTNQCYYSSCQPGQFYDQVNKICSYPQNVDTEATNSVCPKQRPYWDRASLSCNQCPANMPFYSAVANSCQPCPAGTSYDVSKNSCYKVCQPGFQYNPNTLQCQKVITPNIPPAGDQTSSCPPNRPNWNAVTKSCQTCPAATPNWNSQTRTCQKCPMGQNLNPTTNVCQGNTIVQLQCPSGSVLNPITKMCDISGGTMAHCPPDRPFYNTIVMACTACPIDKPIYDAKTNQCISNAAPNTNPNPNPNQNPNQILCPQGTTLDSATQNCIPNSSSSTQQNAIKCPLQTVWDPVKNACVYSNGQIAGQPISYKQGTGTISGCPLGLIFNQSRLKCQCPQGLNYKYIAQKDTCQKFCGQNQYYNVVTDKCQPFS